jgi:CBS domain-containing protein
MRVADIMSTDVATVRPEASLKEVARLLVERGISAVPVVTAGGEVVGVVSEGDLLPHRRDSEPRRRGLFRRARAEVVTPRTAAEVMSAPPVTVEPFWTIPGAADAMRTHGVKRLPVVKRGALVGIVSRADIVRAFARSDEDVRRELRELVTHHQELFSEHGDVDVVVSAGETTLAGEIERRSVAELLPVLVAKVPGVVSVDSRLGWVNDDVGSRERVG